MNSSALFPRLTRRVAATGLVLAVAALNGCGALRPCEAGDLGDPYGFTCAVRGIRQRPAEDRSGCLIGKVAGGAQEPIVVIAYRERDRAVEVVSSSVLDGPGPYRLTVPPGTYRVAAFHDLDGDRRYDPARETATLYHDGGTVVVMPRRRVDRLYLTLRDDADPDDAASALSHLTVDPVEQPAGGACAAS